MDYTSLIATKQTQGSIKSWVSYSKAPVEDILTDAQAWIYQRLRVREMKASATVALASGVSYTALPTDFLDPMILALREPYTELGQYEETDLLRGRTYDSNVLVEGLPTAYAVFDERFNWDVSPDDDYVADLVYYRTPPALGPSNLTNFITTRYPLMLRVLCMGFAASYMKDYTEMKTQLGIADAMLLDIKEKDDLSRRGQKST